MTDQLLATPGGTAANVARILRSLDWYSSLVGTVGDDPAGNLLRSTLATEGVDVADLRLDERWTTPVLLQINEGARHYWRFSCPVCGAKYASHRPTPEGVGDLLTQQERPDVFFFDRVSLFTLALAKRWKSRGSIVFFEPSTLGRPQLFDRAVAVASIVKYSADRAGAFEDRLDGANAVLVKTLGERGVAFRPSLSSRWKEMRARPIAILGDTAGAGDWTTAGMLDHLLRNAPQDRGELSSATLATAITRGQELAADSCAWEGVFPSEVGVHSVEDIETFACPRVISRGTGHSASRTA